ncbi:L-seryl-tRNA(Ser) seleniumtransferase [Caldalkalibacillus uzonensis]|uniref:L-seryl-tRNA(Sec) selenium transferase n=1 Tax=Caldalkalibacillus uzonensis TaxID=353224 RepID=A0ABU0CRE6_9BACI|nr:L-seryl-tRNA(Sec) selenium transferase [Caldalkalibacillus uzonensis]MDQ0338996.1 L-seryl-tRNA(Ser) seleniumtransferase [Caldalkalibacillus uzonensis]
MLTTTQQQLLRQIPAIHELLSLPDVQRLNEGQVLDQETLTQLCQKSVEQVRQKILTETRPADFSVEQEIIQTLAMKIKQLLHSPLKPVINGTGVVLHTNLGRAKLSKAAQRALTEVATYYSSLEFNLVEGTRGSRHDIVEKLICHLTGAEAALVCNNNAAAVYLVLKEMATNKEVIVSRGELVEIGGSFRVFEIMRESGANLVEVGTTNKTHLYDYERAISERTGLIMKVHTSNFVIKGFTASVPGHELVQLAHQRNLPVFEDLGSGVLFDLRPYGIGNEPTVQDVLREGIDLVSFSGDKLLGGPQAGIIAGKAEYIKRLKKNQLMRSLRVDKFTLAALHATLKAYLNPAQAKEEIPTLRMILQAEESIKAKAEQFINQVDSSIFTAELIQVESEVGGGTLPEVTLPSWGVKLTSSVDRSISAFSKRLRTSPFPVVGRIMDDHLILDFRTIDEEEIPIVLKTLHGQAQA